MPGQDPDDLFGAIEDRNDGKLKRSNTFTTPKFELTVPKQTK